MLDPRTGEVLALASTPTYDAGAIADPDDGPQGVRRGLGATSAKPLLDRADPGPLRPGLGVQDRDVDRGARVGRDHARRPATPPAAGREGRAARVAASGSATATIRSPARGRWPTRRRSRCPATSTSRWPGSRPAATGSPTWAAKLGFGAPIPFDLPTAASPGHQRRRLVRRRLRRRRGAGERGLRPGARRSSTPLQMALVAATVANGGTLMRPHLVIAPDRQGRDTDDRPGGLAPGRRRREVAAEITAAMVSGGRGRRTAGCSRPAPRSPASRPRASPARPSSAGRRKPHSWFIGFAPGRRPAGRDRGARRVAAAAAARGPSPLAGEPHGALPRLGAASERPAGDAPIDRPSARRRAAAAGRADRAGRRSPS